ncbi:MAG TPA: GNAT family N-acetyltransferase [Acidimicrobiales bacterium]|nr:GNAT family N-acetyltransferase [Acidimicrobiales bacterium]
MTSPESPFERLDADRADAVVELCRRCLDDPPTADEVLAGLYSPDQPVVVRGDPDIGIVAAVPAGSQGYIRLLGVDPAARGRGHGTALLRAAEADLAALGATSVQVGADPPYYLYPGVETSQTALLCLLERHGYQRVDSIVNMEVDLRSLPPDPGGHVLAGAGERAEVGAWLEEHWPSWKAEALRALERSTLVISRDDLGIAAFCAYDVNRGGLLGPVAVRGDLWGKGVGRPLIVGALHRMRRSGRSRAEVAWVGPLRPYVRVGARVSRVFFVHRRALGRQGA